MNNIISELEPKAEELDLNLKEENFVDLIDCYSMDTKF